MNSYSLSRAAIRSPQQARSRETMNRIERAAEQLMETTDFSLLPVAEITMKAGVAVGSFYTRFPDKASLLEALHERYQKERTEAAVRFCDREVRIDAPLEQRCHRLVEFLVGAFRSRRAVLRSFAMHVRSNPRAIEGEPTDTLHGIYSRFAELLLSRREEIEHPDPEQAVRFGILLVAATCRNKIVFGEDPHPSSVDLTDRELVRELTRVMIAYLKAPPKGVPRQRRPRSSSR